MFRLTGSSCAKSAKNVSFKLNQNSYDDKRLFFKKCNFSKSTDVISKTLYPIRREWLTTVNEQKPVTLDDIGFINIYPRIRHDTDKELLNDIYTAINVLCKVGFIFAALIASNPIKNIARITTAGYLFACMFIF